MCVCCPNTAELDSHARNATQQFPKETCIREWLCHFFFKKKLFPNIFSVTSAHLVLQ